MLILYSKKNERSRVHIFQDTYSESLWSRFHIFQDTYSESLLLLTYKSWYSADFFTSESFTI